MKNDELWLERAFERALPAIPLPPEQRWLPPQRLTARSPWSTVLTLAVLALALGLSAWIARDRNQRAAIGVPESMEEAAWHRVLADSPAWVPVLRPTWLPARVLDTDAGCGYPIRGSFSHPPGATANIRAGVASYAVDYHPDANSDACAHVRFTMRVEVIDGNPVAGMPNGRGSNEALIETLPVLGGSGQVVYPNERPSELRLIYVRGPFVYRIAATGLTQDEFERVVNSLAEVSR